VETSKGDIGGRLDRVCLRLDIVAKVFSGSRRMIRHDLMQPIAWLFAFLYMALGLIVAHQIVIRASGLS
jgi:hypothetical protein